MQVFHAHAHGFRFSRCAIGIGEVSLEISTYLFQVQEFQVQKEGKSQTRANSALASAARVL